jgi:hypothetical protein
MERDREKSSQPAQSLPEIYVILRCISTRESMENMSSQWLDNRTHKTSYNFYSKILRKGDLPLCGCTGNSHNSSQSSRLQGVGRW